MDFASNKRSKVRHVANGYRIVMCGESIEFKMLDSGENTMSKPLCAKCRKTLERNIKFYEACVPYHEEKIEAENQRHTRALEQIAGDIERAKARVVEEQEKVKKAVEGVS